MVGMGWALGCNLGRLQLLRLGAAIGMPLCWLSQCVDLPPSFPTFLRSARVPVPLSSLQIFLLPLSSGKTNLFTPLSCHMSECYLFPASTAATQCSLFGPSPAATLAATSHHTPLLSDDIDSRLEECHGWNGAVVVLDFSLCLPEGQGRSRHCAKGLRIVKEGRKSG